MEVTLKVHVPTFVRKYIEAKHGHPWRLDSRYQHGRMLCEFLQRAPNRKEKYKSEGSPLVIIVPSKTHLRKGCFLSQAKIDAFVELIYFDIQQEIQNFYEAVTEGLGIKNCNSVRVVSPRKNGTFREHRIPPSEGEKFFSQKEIVNGILKKYDITEDDLTYDAVIKGLQRRINRKMKADYQ